MLMVLINEILLFWLLFSVYWIVLFVSFMILNDEL